MVFTSQIFVFLFLPIAILGYYILFKKRSLQNLFLLLISLGFYFIGEPRFVFVLILSCLINWFLAIQIHIFSKRDNKNMCKILLLITLLLNLGLLFSYKYLPFSFSIVNDVFRSSFYIPNIILPIGLSFFTFQAISYVIDVYRNTENVQLNPINVMLYIAFFPQLIAGPIVRYSTIQDQIMNRKESGIMFCNGVERFLVGFSKKVLISNNMAVVADAAFNTPIHNLSLPFAWLGMIAYTLQIYYDFSGYSDMAIGLGNMFGFQFSENFNYPYISKTITDFWRRWHISLGSWFRDYVYFPLGGSHVSSSGKIIRNLFIVWLLTGIWHGANYTFIVWGLLYFILLTIEKLSPFDKILNRHPQVGHVYTMFFVMIGWVVFRSINIQYAIEYIKCLFDFQTVTSIEQARVYFTENIYFFSFAIAFAMPIGKKIEEFCNKNVVYTVFQKIFLGCAFILSILYIINGSYNPFIYFNF